MKTIARALLFLISCVLAVSGARADARLPATQDIVRDIQRMRSERNLDFRMLLAKRLQDDMYMVWDHRALASIDDCVIDELISLLEDNEDGVRGVAASIIGDFGTRALRAEPALRRALDRVEEERGRTTSLIYNGADSAVFIVPALKRIQGVPDNEIFDDPPMPHY